MAGSAIAVALRFVDWAGTPGGYVRDPPSAASLACGVRNSVAGILMFTGTACGVSSAAAPWKLGQNRFGGSRYRGNLQLGRGC